MSKKKYPCKHLVSDKPMANLLSPELFTRHGRQLRHRHIKSVKMFPEAEFKEFEPRLKFKNWLKYGWFYLKLYSIFQDSSWCLIETGF